MKTLGLIGGISYHSNSVYYNLINQQINKKLGGNHAAKMIVYSVNYADIKELQTKNDWNGMEAMLSDKAVKLENAGAECILISCNAAHRVADSLIKKLNIPFIHIAEATAKEIAKQRLNKVALIGTKFTMQNSFFTDRLKSNGIETIIPEDDEMDYIHETILTEFAKGNFKQETKIEYLNIINKLADNGAQAVILGCTEIGLLLNQTDTDVKIIDTTEVHITAAVEFAISN